ncbi:hypothetical protein LEN26_003276 [Aphanomyces euteiches]|nr:hypothetical protein LEN26_003276 [Aphanomyces euteiches]
MSLLSLAEWAKEEFKLSKCPAKSSIQTILKARGTLEPLDSVENANARRKKTLRCLSDSSSINASYVYKQANFAVRKEFKWVSQTAGSSSSKSDTIYASEHGQEKLFPSAAKPSKLVAHGYDKLRVSTASTIPSILMNPRYITALSQKINAMSGFKNDKSRLTIGLAANADGTEKLDLVFIGISKEPRCFKRVGGVTASGLQYWHAKEGWMTSIIFQDWLSRIEQKFKAEGRHVIMLVDNVSSHRLSTIELEYVRVVFLPPKTTAVLQPMDAGVIAAFKQSYKSSQMETSLTRFDNGLDVSKCFKFDILEAMEMSTRIWSLIDATSIANSWGHTGILAQESDRDGNLLLNMLAEVHL